MRQEEETSEERRKQEVRVVVARPRFWRLEGCNVELVSCRFIKQRYAESDWQQKRMLREKLRK